MAVLTHHHHPHHDEGVIKVYTDKKHSRVSSIFIIIALLIAIIAGLIYYITLLQTPSPSKQIEQALLTRPIFTKTQAQFSGQVTRIQGTTLFVKDALGHTDQFDLSPQATISSDLSGTPITSQTASQKIPLHKDVLFYLELKGNQYQIVSLATTPAVMPPEETISHPPSSTRSGSKSISPAPTKTQ